MKIEVNEKNGITLKEVYTGVSLETSDGETMGICMRDSGFEFSYQGKWYEAKNGVLKEMKLRTNIIDSKSQATSYRDYEKEK